MRRELRTNAAGAPIIRLPRRRQALRQLHRAGGRVARRTRRRGRLPDRAVRIGQVDAAALHERPRDDRWRRHRVRGCTPRARRARLARDAPADGDGVPELRALPAPDGRAERRRGSAHRLSARGSPKRGVARRQCSTRWASPTRRPAFHRRFRAVSSSVSRSRAHWRWSPT